MQQGKYRIYVTDPKWIEHLPIGHTYGTAAYSDDGPWIVENLSLDLPMPEDAQCRKQGVSGFWNSELPPRDSSMANEMIRDIAQSTGPLSPEDFSLAMKKHKIFLEQGTEGLKFTGLDAAGFPMTIIERQYGGMVGNSLVGEGYLEKLRKIANTNEGTHLAMIMRSVDPNTKLENENFTFSDWNGSYAKDAQFINCIFDRSLMTNGYYANANFEGSSFVGVDFTDSDLTNANFRNCNLTKADFEICNCDGADFTGANLSGASFKGASLNNVKR